ncbi:putative membrane protein [Escherichia coli 2-427-07_S4_C1]|nr:putative membrane protein [Escherichia coli 3-073-06_S4_C1]KDW09966.1 putative membrane protein [Escherichia coli 2-156-04_S3_C3]KDY42785.1 putative membrane protein [Escherichia coli 2-427-07_S4_C1]KEK98720.1 putative membrane protein [Escherichia coli 4-203-08_S3_C3]KEM08738.1 putative membrane protein [Escherichia coli 6-175-07_S4_C2]
MVYRMAESFNYHPDVEQLYYCITVINVPGCIATAGYDIYTM